MANEKEERIIWIDIAKGIGILLMVYGHVCTNLSFYKWIYSFHMPLFFVISGLTFKVYEEISNFFRKKIRSLIMPYMLGGIVTFSIYNGIYLLNGNLGIHDYYELVYNAQKALIKGNWSDLSLFNSPLWFIPCLVITEILFYIIAKIVKEDRNIFLICLYIATLANLNMFPFVATWHFTEALSYLFWLSLGYCFKGSIFRLQKSDNRILYGTGIAGIFLSFFLSQFYETIVKHCCEISFIGIVTVINISILIMRGFRGGRTVFIYVGQSSMWILLTHIYFIYIIERLTGNRYQRMTESPIISLIISIAIITSITMIRFLAARVGNKISEYIKKSKDYVF